MTVPQTCALLGEDFYAFSLGKLLCQEWPCLGSVPSRVPMFQGRNDLVLVATKEPKLGASHASLRAFLKGVT